MAKHIIAPPHGVNYRVRNGGTVGGFYYLEGRRTTRVLARLADLQRDAQGRRRTPAQLDRVIQRLWEEKLGELHQTRPAKATDEPSRNIGELFGEWIAAAAADKAPGTRAYYTRTTQEYLTAAGDHPLSKIGLAQVDRYRAYLAERKLSVASINIRLQNLKTFLRWAHERDFIERIPKIRLLRREKRLARVLSEDDVTAWFRMLQAIRRHRPGQGPVRLPNGTAFHPNRMQRRSAALRERFLRVAYDTGCRSSEIFHLELAQFDLKQGLLRVEFKQRFAIKERREKVIPLTKRLRRFIAALRRCYPHERYLLDDGRGRLAYTSPGAFAPQLQRNRAALGFNGRGVKLVHGFRALYAHRLRERGAPLDAIKNLLGHSDIKVTEGYFPASQTRERAAVALLDGP
jgi:integrase